MYGHPSGVAPRREAAASAALPSGQGGAADGHAEQGHGYALTTGRPGGRNRQRPR